MKAFLQPLQNLAEMEQIREQAKDNRGVLAVSGCMESQKAHMIYGLSGLFPCHLIISEDERSAKQIYEDYRFYDKNVYYYPPEKTEDLLPDNNKHFCHKNDSPHKSALRCARPQK